MKIKVAILEQDQNYQNRLLVALRERFSEKLEIFPCNSGEDVAGVIEKQEVKVFAVNQMIDIDLSVVPEECAVVILTEMRTAERADDYETVCKYQRVNDIGKQLYRIGKNHDRLLAIRKEQERKAEAERLERERREEEERLRREKEEEEERQRLEQERLEREKREEEERIAAQKAREEEERQRVLQEQREREERLRARRRNPALYVFISAEQGEGSSVTSIACTICNRSEEYNTLYLDFRQIGKLGRFFVQSPVGGDYGDLLMKAISGELTGEMIKNAISTDSRTGIDYINNVNCMYELAMLGAEGFNNFMRAVGELEEYDNVVINLESTMSQMTYAAITRAKKVIFVGSGLPDSNNVLKKKVESIKRYDELGHTDNISKVNILYNRFVNRNCTALSLDNVTVTGMIPVIKEKTETRLLDSMLKQPVFEQIIEIPEK